MADSPMTRRTLLTNSSRLAAGGALALGVASLPTSAFARRRGPRPVTPNSNDIDVLNYALTLEHLEAAFYVQGVEAFSDGDISEYLINQGFGPAVATDAYARIVDVRDHEVTHVETLISVIQSLGGQPIPSCVFDFSAAYGDVATFLATSQVLEDTGVRAYTGALALIVSADLQTAGATIATVEARHASYFRTLTQVNPFPAAFDTPESPASIINQVLATGFVVSCPVTPPTPGA